MGVATDEFSMSRGIVPVVPFDLHLGSTRTSTMQPWVATGFLRPHDAGLIEALTRAPLAGKPVPVDHALTEVTAQLRSIVVKDA